MLNKIFFLSVVVFFVINILLLFQVFESGFFKRDLSIEESHNLELTKFDDYSTLKRQKIIAYHLLHIVKTFDLAMAKEYWQRVRFNPLASDYWSILAYTFYLINFDKKTIEEFLRLSRIYAPHELNVVKIRSFIETQINSQ